MNSLKKCYCNKCDKRILNHKPSIKCSLCNNNYHGNCSNMLPSDIKILIFYDRYNSWICTPCCVDIFPFSSTNEAVDTNHNRSTIRLPPQESCHVCFKPGRNMMKCEVCTEPTHNSCFSGPIGCKSCMANAIPGFNVDNQDLFHTKTMHHSHKLFNPFDTDSSIFKIGTADENEGAFEQDGWSTCSSLLNNCRYYELSSITKSRNSELKVFSLNINSLYSKISQIRDEINQYSHFDILCFNETSCNGYDLPFGGAELNLDYFHAPVISFPARESRRGGGLAVYINRNLCPLDDISVMHPLSENTRVNSGEFLFVEISRKYDKNIIVGNMYRSPNSIFDPNDFIKKINEKLALLKNHSNKLIILASDSNIDLLKYGIFTPTTNLVDTLTSHGFCPVISRPTRITEASASLIDHIFVNNITQVTKSGIITVDHSDHLAPFVNLITDRQKITFFEESQSYRLINEEQLLNFKAEIAGTDWSNIDDIDHPDDKYNAFETKYREKYEKCFPTKTRKNKKRKCDKPWILPWLQSACDRKNRLYYSYIKHPTDENKAKYKKMKIFVDKHRKKAKLKFNSNYFNKYSGDCRKQWSKVNELLSRRTKSKVKITKLKDEHGTVTNDREISEKFNNFFCNIAQKLKDEQGHPWDRGRPPESTLDVGKRSEISMANFECTVLEIEEIIKGFKNKATSDLAMQPLKFVCNEIAPVIRKLIDSSLKQGYFPDRLKCAKVIPLYKLSGSRADTSNYRPISLLSCFSKIYEKVMHKHLSQFMIENNTLYQSQYGFRAMHSCEHALLEAQNCINLALERKKIAVLLLIDFSKAFDMVDHSILLSKLDFYGIRGNFLEWFRTYLTGREQYVFVNNNSSSRLKLDYGVPQGSILGPLLFILYINDLPGVSNLVHFIFYADDANVVIIGDDPADLQDQINILLRDIDNWVKLNGLKLNVKKTKFMIFTKKRIDLTNFTIIMNDLPLERVTSERFLGVILDQNLSWNAHITKLASKISMNSGIIFKLKGIVPQKVLMMLYNSFIQSHLNYCSSIWGLGSHSSISRLFRAQKKAVRAVDARFNRQYYNKETGELPCHTKAIFNRNRILTVHNLITKNCLTTMHKTYLGLSPTPINNLFIFNHNLENISRRGLTFFTVPRTRLISTDKSLQIVGPKVYNHIINDLRQNSCDTDSQAVPENLKLKPFKRMVRNYLVDHQKTMDPDVNTWNLSAFLIYKCKASARF